MVTVSNTHILVSIRVLFHWNLSIVSKKKKERKVEGGKERRVGGGIRRGERLKGHLIDGGKKMCGADEKHWVKGWGFVGLIT